MTVRTTKMKARLSCQRAFQKMVRQCLTSVRQKRVAAGRGDPDAVHLIRIALTRLRAARKFFGAMTRDATWPKLKVEIRWLNSVLGAARDNDVTIALAGTVQHSPLAVKDDRQLASAAARTHRQLAAALRSARCDRLLAGLARWIDKGAWLTAGATTARRRAKRFSDYAPHRLQRWKRRLTRKAAHGLGRGRRRHRLRIATKYYRYMREACTAFGLPEDRAERRNRAAAQSVQRALGDIRDLHRLRELQPAMRGARSYRRQKKRLLHKAKRAFKQLG